MKSLCYTSLLIIISLVASAQQYAGPMLGPVTHRTASLWLACDVNTGSKHVVEYWKPGNTTAKKQQAILRANPLAEGQTAYYFTWHYDFVGLEPGTTYQYQVSTKGTTGITVLGKGKFTTQTLFQWRNPAPDFHFIAGSCAYFNEPEYDRPGRPYGTENGIFETMARETKASFMFWLGDNWYTRDVDYTSEYGLWYRAWRDRSQPVLKNLLAAMPNIAIWDDHDYGPNDNGASYALKQTSREVFKQFWRNPTYGINNEGIFSRYQFNDVDFFMLDDRWWRDFDEMPDSLNGKPNPDKHMLGKTQLNWLKQELNYSKTNPMISFRIIAVGSQVMNPASPYDKLKDFPAEYEELMHFIRDEKIPGVLFMNGDRHHSEILKVEHPGMYPMYEITCSPLTSGTHEFGGTEKNNAWRIVGVDRMHNYGRIDVSGARGKRKLGVQFKGADGKVLGEWSVNEDELKWSRN